MDQVTEIEIPVDIFPNRQYININKLFKLNQISTCYEMA